MKPQTRQSVKHERPINLRAATQPETINIEARTVEIVWSVGAGVMTYPWFSEPYEERLSMDPAHVRLGRFNSGAAVLDSHLRDTVGNIIGVIEKAWLANGEGRALVRFSKRADVEPIWQDVVNGILRNVSVGYIVYTYRDITQPGDQHQVLLAIDWEPMEASFLAIGADAAAGVRSALPSFEAKIILESTQGADSAETQENRSMSTKADQKEIKPTPSASPANPSASEPQASAAVNEEQVRAEAQAAERERSVAIVEACRKAKLPSAFAEKLVKEGTSLDKARALIIDEVSNQDAPTPARTQTRVETGDQDETVTRRTGAENALLHRSMPAHHQLSEMGRVFRGMSLLRLAEEFLGSSSRGMNPNQLASRALTTSDFPLVLGNVAEKMLMNAYKTLPKTFEPLAANGELTDYKPAYRYQIGDAPALQEIPEGDEYKFGSFGEKAEQTQLKDYGIMIRLTRQMIVNDDLHAFQRVIQNFGGGAGRLESSLFWAVFTGNPVMGDGTVLFHANHGNLATAAAISETSLALIEKLIMDQKTLDSVDYLNLVAKFLWCGTAKKVEAQKLLTAITATKSGDVNPFNGAYQLIVEPRVTGNQWGLACSPSDIPTVEISRMSGEAGPVVDSKEGWTSDGLEVKCRHTVAVKALEWKGLAKNPGA